MENHPIENLMKSTMENIKEMVDVNTIIGDPIKGDRGTLIIPISRVSFGFVSGGSEFNTLHNSEESKNYPFGGGSGSGISIKPVAFLVIKDECVRLMPLDSENTYDKLVDLIPQLIDTFKHSHKEKENCKIKEKEKEKVKVKEDVKKSSHFDDDDIDY